MTTVENVFDFLQRYNGGITALATAAVCVLTVFLVLVSRKQAKLIRQSIVENRRAFVFPNGIEVTKLVYSTGLDFRIVWKNSGDTPTRNLNVGLTQIVSDAPLPRDYSFPEGDDLADIDVTTGVGIIPPGSSRTGGLAPFRANDVITDSDVLAINARSKFLYLTGYAAYSDIFDTDVVHLTRFFWNIERILCRKEGSRESRDWTVVWRSHGSGNTEEDVSAKRYKRKYMNGRQRTRLRKFRFFRLSGT